MEIDLSPNEITDDSPIHELEVMIDDISCDQILLRLDEEGRPRLLPNTGFDILSMDMPYAIISIREKLALEYNLI